MRSSLKSYLVVCACLTQISLIGQNLQDLKINHQIWLDIAPSVEINERLIFVSNIGLRSLVTDLQWTRIYLQPSVKFSINETFSARGGISWALENADIEGTRFEIRPWQGIQTDWPKYRGLRFIHLIRLEQRLNHLFKSDLTEFELRSRFRTGFRWRSLKFANGRSIVIPLAFEVFVPITNSVKEVFSNRLRLTTGFAYMSSDLLQFRFTINWQRNKATIDDSFEIRDWAYRFVLLFSLNGRDVDNLE